MNYDGLVQIQKDLEQLISDAKKLMSDVSEVSEKDAVDLKAAGVALLNQALDQINTIKSQVVQTGEQVICKTQSSIHKRPMMSLGLAALVGGLVGAILARK
ncbi:DUF883 family protein [Polynucleobacter kasalickyi]|uniref:Membrane-anchored ribosome-binding protein, inhibits growth in stationary phase, ElaB/YqjD/DUF883 family n=1 Tax=Polynucleobacter kasalickyi TaxID=1938817 RepID=A0A1W1Z801_9BURK|nr:DUF883 family protein [Polynucleobacter kasalickyi]SMC44607.1 Membrane-anchored ribosome-binding protein, inhibits growth in stationary phase, ElaB/YqjD/DUF883 family [Polynucleobacter kasalickyi]